MALVSYVTLCMLLVSMSFFTCLSTKLNLVNNSLSLSSLKSSFTYSTVLVVTVLIGTPPQPQQMMLDTGSQLSWIKCDNQSATTSFHTSLSSSFSILPCTHQICKPRIPDFTIPTTCDQNRHCHYSFFYADGTIAEGNLVQEKLVISPSQTTLPKLVLGCVSQSSDPWGILGMNLGRLSFPSQAKIANKFSYCVPTRQTQPVSGSFYLGDNPFSTQFRYVNMLTFSQSQRMPNLDPLAYTLPMQGIRINGKKLDIPPSVFLPDAGGSGQTIIDSGSEFTYLVDAAYDIVRAEVVKTVGAMMKKGYVYGGVLDMCFDGDAIKIIQLVGDMVFEFNNGVEIVIPKERVLADVGGGVHCVGIGRSQISDGSTNIIGNFHQQNLWVEYDLDNSIIGFGVADCSKLAL